MTILRTDTVSGIGTEGTVLEGNITIDSLNYMTLPKGTTSQRYSLEGRDPDYHKLKLHLPLVHHTQFDDYSPASPSITANYDSHISSKSGVFENSAALFSRQGANDWIGISDSTDNDLGSDDFTIECWFMCVGGGTNGYLVQKGTASGNWSYFIQFREATDSINFYGTSDGTNFDIVNGTSFGSTILPNKWYHVAVCRSGNTFSYYINGQKGSTTDTSSASFNNSSVDLRIPESGGFGATEEVFLQDVRLYKGVAKYNETFIPQKLAEDGAIRYNTDSNKIECYNGTKWMNISVSSPDLGGNGGPAANPTGNSADQVAGARGLRAGGQITPANARTDRIDYITIPTAGDATDFGNLTQIKFGPSGAGSNTRAVFMCGGTPSRLKEIDYVTFSSTGDAQDFGDMTEERAPGGSGAHSNQTRGIVTGGSTSSGPGVSDRIDYITIASTGAGQDFGNLSAAASGRATAGSPTRAIMTGGDSNASGSYVNTMDFVTMTTRGDAKDFGDLMKAANPYATSNSIKYVCVGNPSSSTLIQNMIISSLGNTYKFGDLATSTEGIIFSCNDPVRGVFGVLNGGTSSNIMQYISFPTGGISVDFGNLTQTLRNASGASNAHGGL